MKANAKKLLALILAMVMCLSLAAPAFAAGGDVLAVQGTTVVVTNTDLYAVEITTTDKDFTVKLSDGSVLGTYEWGKKDKYPTKYVKVTEEVKPNANAKVGEFGKTTVYTVAQDSVVPATATDAVKKLSVTHKVADTDDQVTLKDVKWTELSDTQNWVDAYSNKIKERQGFIYQEQQDGGKYKYFFKLYATKKTTGAVNKDDDVYDKSAEVYYAVSNKTGDKLTEDKDIRDVLFGNLQLVEPNGTAATTNDFYKGRSTDEGSYTATLNAFSSAYEFDINNVDSDVLKVSFDRKTAENKVDYSKPTFTFKDTDKVTTTIGVRLSTVAVVEGRSKDMIVGDSDVVLAEVKKQNLSGWAATEISSSAVNGYWTVTLTKGGNGGHANKVDQVTKLEDNTVWYNGYGTVEVARSNGYGVGLKNLDKEGSYKYKELATSTEEKLGTISSGKKVLGPVAVKLDDIPVEVRVATKTDLEMSLNSFISTDKDGKKWAVFTDTDALAHELPNLDCGKNKQVPYIQLVLNPIVNGKANDAIDATKDGSTTGMAITQVDNWLALVGATGKNVMTESGTATLVANTNKHVYVTKYTEVAATCKKAGSKTSTVVCKRCGKVIASAGDSETIPVVTTAVKRNDAAGANYVYTAAEAKNNGFTHYIADFKIEKTDASKTAAGKVVVHYYCNLGEEHEELAQEKEVSKITLDHASKFSYKEWGDQNTQYNRDPAKMYGFNPMVFDVDKELKDPEVPMKGDEYYHFEWLNGANLKLQTDGKTYFGLAQAVKGSSVTANGSIKTPAGEYIATATVDNIVIGEKECKDGSATITLNVYKVNYSGIYTTLEAVQKAVAEKKLTLVDNTTQVKEYTIPASKTHIDANNDGKCDNCGTAIEQGNTEPTPAGTDISKATVKFAALTYTGKVAQPTVTVTLDGVKLAKGVDYEVEEMQDVNAGTYPLVVKGKGDFSGRVVGNVTIKKASGKISAVKSSVKVGTKKKVTGKLTVTRLGSGKISFKKVSKNGVTISKTGKVTIAAKKPTKKFTMKVKVTVAADANYKKVSKTVKLTFNKYKK